MDNDMKCQDGQVLRLAFAFRLLDRLRDNGVYNTVHTLTCDLERECCMLSKWQGELRCQAVWQ